MTPLASVIIPVRNEEAQIEDCLRCVAGQDIGVDRLEVIVADGRSTDRTREVAQRAAQRWFFAGLHVVDNPDGGISAGLNRALASVTSTVVVRVDARSRIEPHYVRTVLELLAARNDVGVVGGAQVAVAGGDSALSTGIARSLSNRYTTGLSRYRRARTSGPSDTVWMGAFRADELRSLRGWDESLVANEDYDLCERYRAGGYTVWFAAELRSGYVARSDLRAVARQHLAYGRAKGRRWRDGAGVTPRHLLLLALPPATAAAGLAATRRVGPVVATVGGVGGLLIADHVGGEPAPAPVGVRIAAAATSLTVGVAWWLGVIDGLRNHPGR